MILKRTYTNSEWWYCVFESDGGDAVLLATVPAVGCYDIAMMLNGDEKSLVSAKDKSGLTALARDFVAFRDMPIFRNRLLVPIQIDVDSMEIPDSK